MQNRYLILPIRRKPLLLLAVVLLGWISGLHAQVNVPGGGAGPAPGVAFNYRPLGTFWGFDRSQIQLTATELAGAGIPNGVLITRVAFFLNSFNAPTPNTPVQVYLREVTGPAGVTATTYATVTTGASLCFTGTVSAASFTPNSWVTIILNTPYLYTGAGSHLEIMVETNFGGAGGEAFNGKIFSRSNTAVNTYQYWSADNNPPLGNGVVGNSRPDVQLTFVPATPCSNVPAGITAVASPASVCPGTPYNVLLNGLYPPFNSGYTFQWFSSTVGPGGPWTLVPGATQAIYAAPGQIATTWYQCQVRCSMGPITNTPPVVVNMSLAATCYCGSAATSSVDTDIGQVAFGPMTNPAAPGPATNNPAAFNTYTNFTGTVPVQNYTQGTTYPITLRQITSGNFFFSAFFNVFIDYNRDGVFDPVSERVFSGGPTGPTSTTPVTTFVSGSITIPFSSLTGITRMRVVLREGGNATNPPCGNYTWGETEDYNINIVAGPPCGLTNAGTTTSTLVNVCPLQNFTLSLAGTVTLGSGMTWQWQSGPTAVGPWTNIAGATYYPYTRTQATTTWYRCQITCGATNLFSVPIQVNSNLPTQCYCVPVHIPNCNNMWTSNVVFNTLSNPTSCSSLNALAYNIYPATGASTTTVTQNQTYNLSVTTSGIFNAIISVWIDYNFNGAFEASEWQQVAVSNPPGTTAVIPISIPGTSGTGLTGMRIRSRFSGNPNGPNDACLTFGSGETEDYFITINPFTPPACSGTPGPFNTLTSAANACSGSLINLSLNPGAGTIFTGLTYQWQSAPAGVGPWTNIAGATGKTYAFNISQSQWFQCVVTCASSGLSSASIPVNIIVTPATWLGFTDDWNDPTNWCGRVPTTADDALISLLASGRPAAAYFFPVVAVGDTMRAKNLTIASTDSITVCTDTSVQMTIAGTIQNNGKFAIISTSSDSITFGTATTATTLIQAFRGLFSSDNIVQVIYTVSELQAAGMLPNDVIDSLYFRFYTRGSTAGYQNFAISYMLLPALQDQFVANDPLLGVTPVYANPSLLISAPTNGVYTALSASSGILKLPASNFTWDGTSNILLQICYNMTAGSTGGSDNMYVTSTAPRKSTLWLGSNNISTDGCALTTLSPGFLSNFGQVPSSLRPNIGFRFRRVQKVMPGTIAGDVNNNAGAAFWTSMANLDITGSFNNASNFYTDTTNITLNGNFINNGTADFGYAPTSVSRKNNFSLLGTDWVNNGAVLPGNARVIFTGALPQSITGTNPSSFHELEIKKSAAGQRVTLFRPITISDTLYLNVGDLFMNANPITLNNPGVCGGTLTNPIGPVTRAGGFLISESPTATFNWNIGNAIGYRLIPFGSSVVAPTYIPFSFFLSSGDMGQFSVATYNTPASNLPLPPSVTHLNVWNAAASNFTNVVDRFWITEKTGPNPVSNLTFRFTTAERASGMSTFNRGRAQPWRSTNGGTYNTWLRISNTSPAAPAGSGLGTTTSYTQDHVLIAGAADSLRVVNWDWPTLPAGPAPFFAPAGPIGNYLPWAISNNNSPLPVELVTFEALKVGDKVQLKWTTATEINNDYFLVQRTNDFMTQLDIQKVQGAGNSSTIHSYEAWDHQPLPGMNYYRLLQADLDGSVNEAADYVPVRFDHDLKFEIRYLMQENNNLLVFDYNSRLPLTLEIIDMAGRIIQRTAGIPAQEGENVYPLRLGELAPGAYAIRLSNSTAAEEYRFVKGM